jgi:hypothetical protein
MSRPSLPTYRGYKTNDVESDTPIFRFHVSQVTELFSISAGLITLFVFLVCTCNFISVLGTYLRFEIWPTRPSLRYDERDPLSDTGFCLVLVVMSGWRTGGCANWWMGLPHAMERQLIQMLGFLSFCTGKGVITPILKHHNVHSYTEHGCKAPRFLELGTQVCVPAALCARNPLCRRVDGTWRRFRRGGEDEVPNPAGNRIPVVQFVNSNFTYGISRS